MQYKFGTFSSVPNCVAIWVEQLRLTRSLCERCLPNASGQCGPGASRKAAVGAESLELCDVLCNESYREEKCCLLYHFNMGYPMLDEGARVVADVESYVARNPWSRENEKTMFRAIAPEVNRAECCYFIKLRKPVVSFVNEKLGKKFTLTYSADTLPCFVQWYSMAAGDYAIGLEPCTAELDDTFAYSMIAPGEQVTFRLTMGVEELPR